MKSKYIYTLLVACCFTMVTAQEQPTSIDYRNVVLKEVGDSLVMSFDMLVPALTVKRNQSFVVTPQVKDETGNLFTYGYIQLNGKKRAKNLRRTAALKKNYGWDEYPVLEETICGCEMQVLHFAETIPYESWMDEGSLFRIERLLGCNKSSYTSIVPFGVDVEIGYRPPAIPPVTYVAPQPVVKARNEEGKAYLDFHKGKYDIDPTYRRNPEELMRIMEIVHRTNKDKDITLHTLSITGYASPEGSAASNQRLAYNRSQGFMQYIQRVSGIPASKFTVESVGEDWVGLRNAVLESDMRDKDRVMAIIDNDADLDRKEQQLKALGAPYHYLLSEIFPGLRRVEYRISYTVKDYSLTEAQALLNSDPSKLNSYELYLLAKLYEENSDKWNEIIELTVMLYPDDVEANINAAAVYINKGEYDRAKKCIDKVRHLPEAANNVFIFEEMERQGLWTSSK